MKLQLCGLIAIWFMLAGCGRNDGSVGSTVIEWTGRHIIVPDSLQFMTGDMPVTLGRADYTVLNYVDTTGCQSCRFRLNDWMAYKARIDSLSHNKVKFMFVIDHGNRVLIDRRLRRDNFTIATLIDVNGTFNKLNRLPESYYFHTLLLDSAMCVVAMGNPVTNPAVRRLYDSVILGCDLYDNTAMALTEVSATMRSVDLGHVASGDTACHVFYLSNIGHESLTIDDIATSCDCTEAVSSARIVAPGDSVAIRVSMVADSQGPFAREIEIHANVPDSPIVVEICGEVR